MPQTFHLDGKSHAVELDDVLLITGPGRWRSRHSRRLINLDQGDTITMHMHDLSPGEALTIECDVLPATTFYRPLKKTTRRNSVVGKLNPIGSPNGRQRQVAR